MADISIRNATKRLNYENNHAIQGHTRPLIAEETVKQPRLE